jgi:autotransporter-associated beta strand protein
MVAYGFNDPDNKDILQKAYANSEGVFGKLAKSKNMSLYEYAHTVTEDYTFESAYDKNKWNDHEANKAFYRAKLTYGLPQTGTKRLAPVVPEGAEALLETRQPYLTAQQRIEVLYTTAVDSGYAVLDESSGWGRMDLVMAADGYGAFLDNVTVNMDASKGRFNAHDWWRNDISGSGMLTKEGTGTLTLTGANSYTGGTLLKGGTLEAQSKTAFGKDFVYVNNGTVLVNADETLVLNKNFTMDAGVLNIVMDDNTSQIKVEGMMHIDTGGLNLDFTNYTVTTPKDITLIIADSIKGQFANVTADGYKVSLIYGKDSITAHVEAK